MNFLKKNFNSNLKPVFDGSPIFVGGDGRSGTTLLSLVLDTHSQLVVGPELHFGGPKNLGSYAKKCAELVVACDPRVFGKGLKENPDLKLGVQFVKRCHRFGIAFDELIELIDESIRESNSELETFEQRCVLINKIGQQRCIKTDKPIWGMKIMREVKNLNRYKMLWPKARFIHIIRDGRDVAASQLIEHGTWGYADIKKAAIGWVDLITNSRKQSAPEGYFEIKYEDLVMNTESALIRLVDFIGVPMEQGMLKHNKVEHALFDNAYNHASINQVVNPINSSSIERFRKDLTEEQQEAFWAIAGLMLDELGYEK